MQVSLRSRLTAWYALLLVLTMAVFCGAILWLHWQLSLRAFDDGLRSISATASNLVEEELRESRDLSRAASEMAEVVRVPDGVVQVLNANGTPLVDDMLVLARADGGGYRVVMAPLDLTALVDECMHDLEVRAEDSGIAMRSKLQSVSLRGDEALLRRMLSNLLANAITYTPRGGCVTVSLAGSNGQATLEVADTGPGIPPEDRERVFERFVRLDAARGSGGAGLGLAIARWVAEAHGGAIRILSSGSGGSVFSVNLPA